MGRLAPHRHAFAAAALVALVLLGAWLALARPEPVQGSSVSASPRGAIGEEGAGPADALFPADGPSMAGARTIAEAHWGGPACDGEVTVAWAVLEPGTNATASWRNPTHAWDNAAENFDCRIDFNVRADFDWPKLCSVMAHELGHLLGRQHTGDPADLMAPLYAEPLPACDQSPDPARPAEPAPAADEPVEAGEELEVVGTPRPRPARGATASRRRSVKCRAARRMLGPRAFSARAKRLGCTLPRARRGALAR